MTWTHRRERFRAILSGSACVFPASVFDPLSARAADELGFELGMFAGSVASMTVLGDPDLALLTLSEFAGQAYRINRAAELPLLVDADHGYGNALNVMRTVQELEVAGVAALTIEDTELPLSHGQKDGPRLTTIEEGTGKMRAALAARRDPGLSIIGRTSAASVTGLPDAIARARSYAAAGVDGLFFTGLKTLAEIDALRAATSLPLMVGGSGLAAHGREALAAHGVRVCLQGHQPFLAAVNASYQTLKALRGGTPPATLPDTAQPELLKALTRSDKFAAAAETFLDAYTHD